MRKAKSFYIIEAVLMAAGFSQLVLADCYYVPYLFVIVPAFLCLSANIKHQFHEGASSPKKSVWWCAAVLSFLYACMITLANYRLWQQAGYSGILIFAAVALYSVFSILLMAASFSFSVATVSELRAPKRIIILLQLFYALMPYHIMYSMTMWKDVFFGAFVLLFTVFFFRCVNRMSLMPFNYAALTVSAFGVCLFRSNGYFVFALTAVVFLILWKFREKKILFIMIAVLICSFILKHPVLKALGVTQPDLIESLSIPAQQIAREVADNNDLTDEQRSLLSQVVDVDKIAEAYDPEISDPIKSLVRKKGNQDFIKTHAGEFIRLYFSLGARHPFAYLKAWIDQTRGYWNAGYENVPWSDGVSKNKLGIYRTVHSHKALTLLTWYLARFRDQAYLWIFASTGFWDWLVLAAAFAAVVRRDRLGVMLTIPIIMVVMSLLIATPLYNGFRYDYAAFCTLPVITAFIMRPGACQKRA